MRASSLAGGLLAALALLGASPAGAVFRYSAGFQFSLGSVLGPVNPASTALGNGSAGVNDSGNAEGWTVTCPTCTVNQTVNVTRQGFDATGAATTYTDVLTITHKLRQAYPNQGASYPGTQTLNTRDLWALSDYVLAGDVVAGFTNNSTLVSPPVVANWIEPGQTLIPSSNLLHAAVTAGHYFHRAGGQIAAAIFTATDNVGATRTCTASAMTVSTYGGFAGYNGDANTVLEYGCNIDVSGLADYSQIKLSAKLYPFVGTAPTDSATPASTFTGQISTTTLTTTTSLSLPAGSIIAGSGVTAGTRVVSGSGTSYVIAPSQTVAAGTTMTQTNPWELTTRYYLKNTYKAANPWFAQVCPTASVIGHCTGIGSDTTGKWSQTYATAYGTPFATWEGALGAAKQASPRGITANNGGVGAGNIAGAIDGAIIYIAGTHPASGDFTALPVTQQVAAVTITRDPTVTKAQAVLTTAAGGPFKTAIAEPSNGVTTLLSPQTESAIRFADMTILHGSNNRLMTCLYCNAVTSVGAIFDNVAFDNGSTGYNAQLFTVASQSHVYVVGMTATNIGALTNTPFQSDGTRMLRGVVATGGSWDIALNVGSTFTSAGGFSTAHENKAILAFGRRLLNTTGVLGLCTGAASIPDGALILQTMTESIDGSNASPAKPNTLTYDGSTCTPAYNILYEYNTNTGAGQSGREFIAYNQTVNLDRKYRFWNVFANILVDPVSKNDVYDGQNIAGDSGTTGAGAPANRTGAWASGNGVGWKGNLIRYNNRSGFVGGFNDYFGVNTVVDQTGTVVDQNPLFVNYQGTTLVTPGVENNFTAGAGGGDYHLQPGSPCKTGGSGGVGLVPVAGLPFTLDGTARPATNDSCGAY